MDHPLWSDGVLTSHPKDKVVVGGEDPNSNRHLSHHDSLGDRGMWLMVIVVGVKAMVILGVVNFGPLTCRIRPRQEVSIEMVHLLFIIPIKTGHKGTIMALNMDLGQIIWRNQALYPIILSLRAHLSEEMIRNTT